MKKIVLALALAALVALAVPTVAQANFAIHGNYVSDTDACAGCHRAHTSVSPITWSDQGGNSHSALLVSSATKMYEFCYACHDATSQGADTNVQEGVYEGSLYGTQFAILNGGGFDSLDVTATTSTHMMNGASWGAYGGGLTGQEASSYPFPGASNPIPMDCATCHDPHGSPNYRILKSVVNGAYVGGYVGGGTNPTPDGFVSSVETGWPVNGFRLHTAYPNYQPNYTTPMYAKGYDMTTVTTATPAVAEDTLKGMTGWCSGCHTQYINKTSAYNAGDGAGLRTRHRHPMNVPLTNYNAADKASMIVTGYAISGIPVANDIDEQGNPTPEMTDWVECLTCHRAHGTAAQMTGYTTVAGMSLPRENGVPTNPYVGSEVSALLRLNNRGVCEGCHNK